MITEDYVSFETAKLLKEKGFEYNPDESYWLIDANNTMYWISSVGVYDYVDVPTESFQRPKNGYRLITQAMAMKWLRKEHEIFIRPNISFLYPIRYYCEIFCYGNNLKTQQDVTTENFESPEESCEAAIKYCLEKLI